MRTTTPVWLGYTRTGGRFSLSEHEIAKGIAILGQGSKDLAAMFSFASTEVGLKVVALDLDGHLSQRISGYISAYDLSYFLYDSMRIDESEGGTGGRQGELVASAYTVALNLSYEQEAFLNRAIHSISLEGGVASPSSVADQVNQTGEFRGHTADELKGRLESLKSLNITGEVGVVRGMLDTSAIVNFGVADSKQAGELGAGLFLAKLLSVADSAKPINPDVVVLTEANRIFTYLPVARHTNRLLSSFLSASVGKVVASDLTYGLDHHFLEAVPTKIIAGSLWNKTSRTGLEHENLYRPRHSREEHREPPMNELILTSNMFAVQSALLGYEDAFVPRTCETKKGEAKKGLREQAENDILVKLILETIASFDTATRQSLVAFLTPDFGRETVERTVDRLENEARITSVGKDVRRGSPLHTLRLTDTGRELMKRLK